MSPKMSNSKALKDRSILEKRLERIPEIDQALTKAKQKLDDVLQLYRDIQSSVSEEGPQQLSSSGDNARKTRGKPGTPSLQESAAKLEAQASSLRKRIADLDEEKEGLIKLKLELSGSI